MQNPATVDSCTNPGTGYTSTVLPTTDCDDSDTAVHQMITWYLDADGDQYADPETVDSCAKPGTGYSATVLPTTDCNDLDSNLNPDTLWYLDTDSDGYADAEPIKSCSSPGESYTTVMLPVKEVTIPDDGILYPNPTSNEVFIDMGRDYEEVEMTVLNPLGQVIAQSRFKNTSTINFMLVDKSTGVYFVQLMADDQRVGFFRVIKL